MKVKTDHQAEDCNDDAVRQSKKLKKIEETVSYTTERENAGRFRQGK